MERYETHMTSFFKCALEEGKPLYGDIMAVDSNVPISVHPI